MPHKRRTRRSGITEVSGEGQGSDKAPSRIVAHFTRTRHRIARWIAPDLIWNPDMSLELDCWIDDYESACIEIERLESQVDTSSKMGGAA